MTVRQCDYCHEEPVDGDYREVIGVERLRDQGGQNGVIGRKVTGRMPCRSCVRKMQDGVALGQSTLL